MHHVQSQKSKSALLSMLQHVQDIQRIEITLLSDPQCNSEHLPVNPKNTLKTLYIHSHVIRNVQNI